MGRKSKFSESLVETIIRLYESGHTDEEVAEVIGVSGRTITNWKGKHPEFLRALREGKLNAADLVEGSMFLRATGYTHEEEKIFCHEGEIIRARTKKHYPPDTAAARILLESYKPEQFRQVTQVNVNDITEKSDAEIDARLKELLAKAKAEGKGDDV